MDAHYDAQISRNQDNFVTHAKSCCERFDQKISFKNNLGLREAVPLACGAERTALHARIGHPGPRHRAVRTPGGGREPPRESLSANTREIRKTTSRKRTAKTINGSTFKNSKAKRSRTDILSNIKY